MLTAAADARTLDSLDKALIGIHVAVMGLYTIGGLWIKIPVHRAQKGIPPAQSALVGQRIGFDFTVVSWFAFVVVGATGYALLGRAGDLDLATPYTFFIDHSLMDTRYGWALFFMVLFWVVLVVNGLIMTLYFRPHLSGRLEPANTTADLEPFQARLTSAVFWIDFLAWANLVLAGGSFVAGMLIGLDHTVMRVDS